jgi:hypothetical protein
VDRRGQDAEWRGVGSGKWGIGEGRIADATIFDH